MWHVTDHKMSLATNSAEVQRSCPDFVTASVVASHLMLISASTSGLLGPDWNLLMRGHQGSHIHA